MFIQRFHILVIAFFLLQTSTLLAGKTKADSLLHILQQTTTDTAKINTLNKLSDEYRIIGEYLNALKFGQQSLNLSKKIDYKKGVVSSYFNIGNSYFLQAEYPQALKYYLKCLKIIGLSGSKSKIANTYNNIGNIYEIQSDYPRALEYYLKCLKIREPLKDKWGIAESYNNIGNIYADQSNYAKALEYYLKCMEIIESFNSKTVMSSIIYNNLGNIYKERNEYPKALKYYQECLKVSKSLDYNIGVSAAYVNLGNLYAIAAEIPDDSVSLLLPVQLHIGANTLLDSAYNYTVRAYEINKELGRKFGTLSSLKNLGDILIIQSQWKEVLRTYNEAENLAKKIGAKQELCNIYESLATAWKYIADCKIAEKTNDKCKTSKSINLSAASCYNKAYEYQELYGNLKESIFNQESDNRFATLQVTYETEKKEYQIEKLNTEKKLHKEKIRTQKHWLISLMFGLAGIFIFFAVIFRQKTQLKKANKDLVLKNLEIVETEKRTEPIIRQHNPKFSEKISKYSGSTLDESQKEELLNNILYAMESEKVFSQDDMSLKKLAEHLGTNTKYISQVINEKIKVNFITFINEYRIKEARKILSDKANHNLTIKAIATKSGFKSKSSFNNAFKKYTGINPSFFMKSA